VSLGQADIDLYMSDDDRFLAALTREGQLAVFNIADAV
jgi:hypothetical protein